MARERWNQLAKLRASRDVPSSRRAYQALLCLLSADDLKRAREWDLFVRFCEAGALDVDPAEVEMLDPPWPDLKAEVFAHSHYFELAEVVQQDWMKAMAEQKKQSIVHSPLPLTAPLSPLQTIIQKKMRKKYAPEATPLSLLLYSERNALHWAVIEPLVREREPEIRAAFDRGVFDHLWLFIADESRIPFSLSKSPIVASLG